jgi:hypothetical protein
MTIAIPDSSDGALSFIELPTSIVAGQDYTLSLQANSTLTDGLRGLIVFGPPLLRSALEVPITVEPQATTPTAIVVTNLAAATPGSGLTPIGLLGLGVMLGLIVRARKRSEGQLGQARKTQIALNQIKGTITKTKSVKN